MNKFGAKATMADIIRERPNDIAEIEHLGRGKLNGRIRTATRAAPANATDTTSGDAEGDIVVDGTYIYWLLSVSGTLKWHRVSLLVGW